MAHTALERIANLMARGIPSDTPDRIMKSLAKQVVPANCKWKYHERRDVWLLTRTTDRLIVAILSEDDNDDDSVEARFIHATSGTQYNTKTITVTYPTIVAAIREITSAIENVPAGSTAVEGSISII